MPRITTHDIRRKKGGDEAIPVVTAYDYSSARLVAGTGIEMILVGDSLGQTMLGYRDTVPVTVDDIVRATGAVVRGAPDVFVIADMPFMSYQVGVEDTLRNAGRLLKEGGAHAVKLEGGTPVLDRVRGLDDAGVAVMGHLGLTPQSVERLGGYRIQARTPEAARGLLDDALRLEDAGVFAIVLELVPAELAEAVTERLSIPTIGIGSGRGCDGQVQVWHDLMGLSLDFTPRHARAFAAAGAAMREALARYADEVRARTFPGEAETVHVAEPIDLDSAGGKVREVGSRPVGSGGDGAGNDAAAGDIDPESA